MKLRTKIHSCIITASLLLAAASPISGADAISKAPTVNPTGNWKWTPSNPDGRVVEITFNLKLQGEKLTGTVSRSTGTTAITNGIVKGDQVSFQTVRESRAGRSTTTYSGKLSSNVMKGKVVIDMQGKQVTDNWEATRIP